MNNPNQMTYQNQGPEEQNPWEKMAQEVGEFDASKKERAKISEVEDNVYRIEGILTEENIAEINNRKDGTTYIIENTAGLSSDLLKKIKPEGVLFSVKGGLDYENIKKYDSDNYRERTMTSPKGLERVIAYFEHIESGIRPEWDDLQKAMYCYGCLADDFNYGDKQDDVLSRGTAARSLNGIMYGELVCAGFALVYQEMMNRQGIECHYSNQKDTHAYNVLKLGEKYYGVDVTWDNTNKAADGRCGFREFGHDEQFYEKNGHLNYREVDVGDDFESMETTRAYDEDEQRFPLSTFTMDELQTNYEVIADVLEKRKVGAHNGFKDQPIEVREQYLPVDIINSRLVREANQEYCQYSAVLNLLRKDNNLTIDSRLADIIRQRSAYVLDMTSERYSSGAKDFYNSEDIKCYDYFQSAMNRGIEISQEQKDKLDKSTNALNLELSRNLMQCIMDAYRGIDTVIEGYEYDPVNSDTNRRNAEGNARTKMEMILRAKDLLIENGIPESDVAATCAAITTKLENARKPFEKPEKSPREYGIDFLGGVFADKAGIREHIEAVEGRPISDEEFQQKSTDANYLLNSVYTNLNLDEYNISVDDFSKILKGEL